MILDKDARDQSIRLAHSIDPDLFALMRGLSIEITFNAFHGSGVIFGAVGPNLCIVTAKHNLSMALTQQLDGSRKGKKKKKQNEEQQPYTVKQFLQGATVKIVAEDAGFNQDHQLLRGGRSYRAPIADAKECKIAKIAIPKNQNDIEENGLDVAILLVSDGEFAQAVRSFFLKGFVGMMTPGTDQKKWGGFKRYFKLFSSEGQALSDLRYDLDSRGWILVQFGHGKVQTDDNAASGFRFRALPVDDLFEVEGLYEIPQTAEGFLNVLAFHSRNGNTGWRGDSGGPIFLVSPAGEAFYVGPYLGSNYDAEVESDDEDVFNNAVTVLSKEVFR